MADDKTVEASVVIPDSTGKAEPLLRADVRAVQLIELDAVHVAELRYVRHIAEQGRGAHAGQQPLVRHLGGDGPAGAYEEYAFFHIEAPLRGHYITLFAPGTA